MNKSIGIEVGDLVGEVMDFSGNEKGEAIGSCTRVQILIDVEKPLLRWTTVSIGGVTYMIFFRYEKLADFCYLCGRLNHLEKNCTLAQQDGLRYFGPWLRANSKNSICLDEIMRELS